MKNKIKKNSVYIYVCLGKKYEYYIKQIRFVEVLKILILYNRIFGQRFRISNQNYSLKWLYNLLLFKYRITKKNLIQFIRILKYKLKLKNESHHLELGHYGQYCLIVNRGYKIFNFKRNTVRKLYRKDIPNEIVLKELYILKKSQNTNFAPKLIQCNIGEKWYEEELIVGSTDFSHYPRNSKSLLIIFKTIIGPALKRIMFSLPIEPYPLNQIQKAYSKKIDDILSTTVNLKLEIRENIKNFTVRQIELIKQISNPTIYFCFTHGDFCPANIMNTSKGVNIIDWESAAHRSMLFDFYSYMFYRPVHQIFSDFDRLSNEIRLALDVLIRDINPKFKEILDNLSVNQHSYRRIYYLERIIMLTERIKYDEKLNIRKILLDFIHAFDRYDAQSDSYITSNFLRDN